MTSTRISWAGVTIAAALAAAHAVSPAHAASVSGFTSFWSFGDSLSDPGNLYDATGGTEPQSPPYFEGRFSNGPVWAEQVAGDFAAAGLETGNFAFGGARALENADGVPDLATQVGVFGATALDRLGARPVASVWIGANDLIFNGVPTSNARSVGREAAREVGRNIRALGQLGVEDVVLFNLPNLADTPLYAPPGDAAQREQAAKGSAAFNRTLARLVPRLERSGVDVIEIDAAGFFEQLLDDPTAFGVANATIPCLIPGQAPCTPEQAMERAFFDPVHPNAVIHGVVADVVRAEVAPVPLPLPAALLFAGVGAIALVRRRRGAVPAREAVAA